MIIMGLINKVEKKTIIIMKFIKERRSYLQIIVRSYKNFLYFSRSGFCFKPITFSTNNILKSKMKIKKHTNSVLWRIHKKEFIYEKLFKKITFFIKFSGVLAMRNTKQKNVKKNVSIRGIIKIFIFWIKEKK